MVKETFRNILFLAIGLVIGYLGGCNKGIHTVTKEINKVTVDTVSVPIEVPITNVRTRYLTITDTLVQHLTDSVLVEVIKENPMSIPANDYQDTVETDEYTFSYFVGTAGEMMIFNTEIKCKPTVRIIEPVQKNWSVSVGLSNKLTCKLGAGYKGWQLEADLSPKSVNKVYFTKQFNF